jgi:hypothetical protein
MSTYRRLSPQSWGQQLVKATSGIAEIRRFMEENLALAVQAGVHDRINDRRQVLDRFIASGRQGRRVEQA